MCLIHNNFSKKSVQNIATLSGKKTTTKNMLQIDNLTNTVNVLTNGGIILYPTDTIWGIGCDATNAEAIQKIYDLKQRPMDKSFILLADSIEMVQEYVQQVHPRINTLLSLHTRPLTVVYDEAKNLPSILVADNGSIAIRIPQDDYCKNLIRAFGKPLVATSANISSQPFPKSFGSVSSDIIQGVDYVARNMQRDNIESEPSAIVRLSKKGELEFLRK